MQWDRFQQAIFRDLTHANGHTVVQARAGSGKTTTIVAGLDHLPQYGSTLLCAFNRGIRDELEARAPRHVAVKTLHQLGLVAINNHFRRRPEIDKTKGWKIARAVLRGYVAGPALVRFTPEEQLDMFMRLVGLAKNSHVRSIDEIVQLAFRHGLEDAAFPADVAAPLVAECLKRATDDTSSIDFDDMVYLPAKLGLTPPQYDHVLVDEAQDVNAAQLWLSRAACRGRYIAVGDPKQAIYLFRGADAEAMPRIIRELEARVLPLSVTYRCPNSIVDYVRHNTTGVDDLEPAPDAEDGLVDTRFMKELLGPFGARPGDFILSRLNAPLMPICMHFLRHGVPAIVAGRDIGKGLAALIDKTKEWDMKDVLRWLGEYRAQEYTRLKAADQLDRYAQVADQVAAIEVMAEGAQNASDIKRRIESMFSDDRPDGAIVCSTVHKAKGLERDRVWLLQGSFFVTNRHDEEENIYYVACTRAKRELFLVADAGKPAWRTS